MLGALILFFYGYSKNEENFPEILDEKLDLI